MFIAMMTVAAIAQVHPSANVTVAATPPQNIIDAVADMHLIYAACGAYISLEPKTFDLSQYSDDDTKSLFAEAQRMGKEIAPMADKQQCLDKARAATGHASRFSFWLKLSRDAPSTFHLAVDNCRKANPRIEFSDITASCWTAIKTAESLESGFLTAKAK